MDRRIRFVPGQIEDLQSIRSIESLGQLDHLVDELTKIHAILPSWFTEHTRTLIQGGQKEPLAFVSITPQNPGCAEVWAFFSATASKYPVSVMRLFRRLLADSHKNRGIHRFQAVVRMSFEKGHRLMEGLGFQPEGVLVAYFADREDGILYAHIVVSGEAR